MKVFSIKIRKNLRATLFAPLVIFPALLIPIWSIYLFNYVVEEEPLSFGHKADLLAAFVGWFVAQNLTIVFGLPLALLLQHFKKFSLSHLLPLSLIPVFLYALILNTGWQSIPFLAYFSVCVATVFWLIYKRTADGI